MRRVTLLAVALTVVTTGAALAQPGQPFIEPPVGQLPALRNVGLDQRLNEQAPLDLAFHDEAGRSVTLGDCCAGKPVILVLVQYRCPMLCTEVLNGLVDALRRLSFEPGKQYQVVVVSFDAREIPDLAAEKKQSYLQSYGRPETAAGWHFLTGEQAAIDSLAQAVGFRYSYDPQTDKFAHASGIVVLTPQGRIARYFYGIHYSPRDLRLALVEASENKIASPVDHVLLFCFHYDPKAGKYSASALGAVRLGGILTIVSIGMFMLVAWRRNRTKARHALTPKSVPLLVDGNGIRK
ncbi:MAG TPA: SCO family protein [Gemmataceae bacterium]|jgi:protein SCO1/2|nr:SCO family protein [Gemmataceae bacterium]